METRERTTTHWVHGVAGFVLLVVGVASFFDWPRPFDPDTWAVSLLFVAIGLNAIWQLAAPDSSRFRDILCGAFLVAAVVVYLADVPWPF